MSTSKPEAPAKEGSPPPKDGPDEVWQRSPEIIRRFLDLRRDNEQLCGEVEYILRKKLGSKSIETSAIASRAKTLNSFVKKLQRKQYSNPFEEITDLAGARVVCLYRSDIAKVAEIIRAEFEVMEDVNKQDEMEVDQFGYEARHFLVRLGRSSSGARYDDLKRLVCEIQVRTVVQDAWAIIQHHLVYKRESQVPKQLHRKLYSLAGLFESVDDQFENIRRERETYITEVRETISEPNAFLRNELNLDSFIEYLAATFPKRPVEKFPGQARRMLDGFRKAGFNTLRDLDALLKKTTESRKRVLDGVVQESWKVRGQIPSALDSAFALVVSADNWKELLDWGPHDEEIDNARRSIIKPAQGNSDALRRRPKPKVVAD